MKMNLKSYFRGIGAGMIVTAIIMGVSMPKIVSAEPVDKETLIETVEQTELKSKKEIEEAVPSVSQDEAFEEEIRKAVSNNEALRNEEKESKETLKEDSKEDSKEEAKQEDSKEKNNKEEVKEENDKETSQDILPKPIDPMPEGEERDALVNITASQMYRSLVMWGMATADKEKVASDLAKFTDGIIQVDPKDLKFDVVAQAKKKKKK